MKRIFIFFGLAIFSLESFSQETGAFSDPRDGKVYKTVKIGSQWIMAENIAYKPASGNYWAYKFDNSNVVKYGYLYDLATAKKVAPKGWHLPTKEEWKILCNYLGADSITIGNAMKEDGSSGFNALSGGFYIPGTSRFPGVFSYPAGSMACFWTATANDTSKVWSFCFYPGSSTAKLVSAFNSSAGLSVRLFRDNSEISQSYTEPTQQNSVNNNNLKINVNNTFRFWPHKGAILLEAEYFIGDNIDNGFKKTITAENNFLTNLGLTWVTKDVSGNVLSSDNINKYDYSGASLFGGIRCLYYLNDAFAIGGRIGIYSYSQSLTVNGTDELGTLFNFVFIGPSINWHFYKMKRIGFLLKGDAGLAFGLQESVPALYLLVTDNSFADKLPSGMLDLIKSAHSTANFTGFQLNFGAGMNYFIAKWFNIDAGLQLNTIAGSFDKTLWTGTESSISSFSPVFNLSLNFLLRNKNVN